MGSARSVEREGRLAGALPCVLIARPAPGSIDDPLPGARVSPLAGARRSYLLTVTEGAWDDWFVSVAVADEWGHTVARAARDDQSLEAALSRLLAEVEEAIVEDFVARRVQPDWLERLWRALVCRLAWVRRLWRRVGRCGGTAAGRATGRR